MADETPTPADLAQAAADKAQQAQHDTEQGNYAQAGENLQQAENDLQQARDTTPSMEELQKQLARYEAENRKLKDENGDRRVKAKQAEEQAATLKKLAQVLGFEPSDDDPEEQIKQAKQAAQEREAERDKLQAELNRMREDTTLRKLAKDNGADPDMLVPYLRGSGNLPEWGSDDWGGKAAQLVTDTLNSFPQLRAGNAPRTSGNTPSPTRNDDHLITAEELKNMSAEDIYAATKQGKLKHLF